MEASELRGPLGVRHRELPPPVEAVLWCGAGAGAKRTGPGVLYRLGFAGIRASGSALLADGHQMPIRCPSDAH